MNARNRQNIIQLTLAIMTLVVGIQSISHAVSEPQFLDGASTTRFVAEHTPAGTNIGVPIEAKIPRKWIVKYRFVLR